MPVYYAPGSSSMASQLALVKAGAEYDLRFINEDAGEQRTEAYLRINPRGRCSLSSLPRQVSVVLARLEQTLGSDPSIRLQ